MKTIVITFCLIAAVSANPISYNVILESSEHDSNTTESLSLSQSAENDTSELQSSEENTSDQSSESESLESTSEDKTSEESNSQSDENDQTDSMAETRDNSVDSEENVRKSFVQVLTSVVKVLSAEDNSSTEVESQSENLSNELTEKQPKQRTKTLQGHTNLQLVENPSSDTTSNSADTSDNTALTAASSDSSESTSSESNETSETSDSSDDSKSTEDSNASDSTELAQIKTKDCVNGTQSCESEEHFFQNIGDDAHYSVDNLMVPDEDERELSLKR